MERNQPSDYHLNVSKKLLALMEEYNISNTMICGLLDLSPSTISELLKGDKYEWKIKHLVKLAFYFGVTLDEFVFGHKDYIKKQLAHEKAKTIFEGKTKMREYLIENKKTDTLGKLTAEGFFDELIKKR